LHDVLPPITSAAAAPRALQQLTSSKDDDALCKPTTLGKRCQKKTRRKTAIFRGLPRLPGRVTLIVSVLRQRGAPELFASALIPLKAAP